MAAPALSPNCGPRRNGLTPSLIVLHYTAMASAEAAAARLCDPQAEVSAHYLITRTGEVIPLVPEDLRAWHAGEGEWCGLDDINSRSIGVELDNDGRSPFAAPLMDALESLLGGLMSRWPILPEGVIAHSDMAPGRKFDPGPRFDWPRLERGGFARRRAMGHGTAGQGTGSQGTGGQGLDERSAPAFRDLARDCGYTADVPFDALLEAVRLRYRPWAAGPLVSADFAPLVPNELRA